MGSMWTWSTSPFSFSSHSAGPLGWPVPHRSHSVHRRASWACPRTLSGPPSVAMTWAPRMASRESRAAEEAWASASAADGREG